MRLQGPGDLTCIPAAGWEEVFADQIEILVKSQISFHLSSVEAGMTLMEMALTKTVFSW